MTPVITKKEISMQQIKMAKKKESEIDSSVAAESKQESQTMTQEFKTPVMMKKNNKNLKTMKRVEIYKPSS